MKPEDVNPGNFKVEKIVYNHDGFSIATGVWQDDNTKRFAIRWNGDIHNNNDNGFPTSRTHPMWFQLPVDIKDLLSVLLNNSKAMTL